MKLVKMSLVAAMLMGASAFAIENTKVSGDAKLFYQTSDQGKSVDLFDKEGAAGQTALGLGVTTDLLESVSAGAHLTALSTLGLQGQLVNNVWEATNGVSDYYWFDEAWIAGTMGKTTAKAGRMALDTPLVFTETWSIASNTFEGVVLLNQDLPDTTLVAAYVGGGNGSKDSGLGAGGGVGGVVGAVNANGTTNFGQFYNGAYAYGIVNNSWKPLTLQGWYYDATHVVTAYWLQADLNMEGLVLGAQYTGQEIQQATIPNADSQDAYALKLGYEAESFGISGAFAQTGKDAPTLPDGTAINVGANFAGSGQSKLYTEAWWNYGYVTQPDTTSFNVTATATLGAYDLAAYYTNADCDFYANSDTGDMEEVTLSATTSFGALDTSLVYINTALNGGDNFNIVQAYLTLNF